MDIAEKIARLHGPILVLGGSGFVGANLFRMLLRHRSDVFATSSRLPAWRLEGLPEGNIFATDLLVDANLDGLLSEVKPRTIFDCAAYGAYSFETDTPLIYQTNLNLKA
jgi:dolichol-phosphate mannosyltransferase